VFFFSSRRRHTRSKRDWSSDVCSSDLRGRERSVVATPSKAPGIFASLVASTLLAGIFYLAGRAHASGEVLFSWRILATPVLYAPLLLHPGGRRALGMLWARLRSRWWLPFAFLGLAAIISFETWLFMWAPRNGFGLDSSLGFLLLPICLVLGGRFIL